MCRRRRRCCPPPTAIQISDIPFSIFQSTGQQAYTYSTYLQHAWRVIPSVTINGGLRFDYSQAFRDEWQLSPRLSVVWTPTPTTTVHAGYARYFTPPPLIFTSTAQFNQFANTHGRAGGDQERHRPVRARQLPRCRDHPADSFPASRSGSMATGSRPTNLLDDGQFGAPVLQTPFNYKSGYNYGVELTGTYIIGNFSAYGNLAAATQWGKRIETAQSLFSADDLAYSYNALHPHRPRPAHHGVRRRLLPLAETRASAWTSWRAAGSGAASSIRTTPPSRPTRPPTSASLTVSTCPGVGKLEARFDITNLWDEQYKIRDGSGLGVFAPQFGPAPRLLRGTQDGLLIEVAGSRRTRPCRAKRSGAAERNRRCKVFRASPPSSAWVVPRSIRCSFSPWWRRW